MRANTSMPSDRARSVLGDEGAREGYEHNEQLRRSGYAEL